MQPYGAEAVADHGTIENNEGQRVGAERHRKERNEDGVQKALGRKVAEPRRRWGGDGTVLRIDEDKHDEARGERREWREEESEKEKRREKAIDWIEQTIQDWSNLIGLGQSGIDQ